MVQKFEELFARRHQIPYALATTSCTAALHLAAMAIDLKPGDEVIIPAFTWVTSAHCAEYVGARAVFADVDIETYNLDPTRFEAAISPQTRAVVVVHLFGRAAEMDEIMAIAREHNLAVIEDAACAVGTTYAAKPVGGIGDIGCFSFHPRKIITTGEGGMVTTRVGEIAKKIRGFRNHGSGGPPPGEDVTRPYTMAAFNRLGFNLRLSDIQAAVGVAQIAKLDGLLDERKGLAENYSHLLEGLQEEIYLPRPHGKCGHTFQSYVIRLLKGGRARRNRIMDEMAERKIETRPGTHAVHRLGYYLNKYHLRPEIFPNACLGEDTTITLPLFPGMTLEDQEFVSAAIREALQTSVGI
jgi:dTDP-4-amino-4,6-dideoxygalactose transaminase